MSTKTTVNFMTVVHKGTSGMAIFFPDVCKTPAPPAPFVPIPYPNIAQSKDTDEGTSTLKIDGNPVMIQDAKFKMSSGDEAGSLFGMVSSKNKGKAEFTLFSFDVKFEGKSVTRLLDLMIGNEMAGKPPNTPPSPELQAPLVIMPPMDESSGDWDVSSVGE